MSKRNVYLAGPITGLSGGEAKEWRTYSTEIIQGDGRWHALDPLRGKDAIISLKEVMPTGYSGRSADRVIFRQCKWDIQHKAEVVLVNVTGAERVSIGTVAELAYAEAYGKFIILCMEPGNLHQHCFPLEQASIVVPTLEEGIDYLLTVL